MDNENNAYLIPECNLGNLKDRIEKLNRRAKRIGVDPIELKADFAEVRFEAVRNGKASWVTEEVLKGASYTPTGDKMAFYDVTVSGETPHYDGWSFVASLEPLTTDDGETLNVIKGVPGEKCPAEMVSRIGECDHCNLKRRRNKTFVVRHENGDHKVVGRNCIADFLGGANPESLVARASFMAEIGEACSEACEYSGGGSATGDMLDEILAIAASAIEHCGWTSKSKAWESSTMSTAEVVSIKLSPPRPSDGPMIREIRETVRVEDKHREAAEAAIEWAKSIADEECENNDYLSNVRLIASCEWCGFKNLGIAVSIVSAHMRHMDRLRYKSRPAGKHVGVIKKRMTINVTCERVIANEGYYGMTGIHKLVDDAGNDVVWFASSSAAWLEAGMRYTVKATPKEHSEYAGRPQTVVSRLAVVEELGIAISGAMVA